MELHLASQAKNVASISSSNVMAKIESREQEIAEHSDSPNNAQTRTCLSYASAVKGAGSGRLTN